MPKKIKNCFYDNLTFEKLLEAHTRARKHKTYKNEVIQFELNLENNIINLLNKIRSNQYRLGNYRSFTIYEPKERCIKALPYTDRVVHQWYVEEFIKPYIVPKFIDSSFACIENKGAHKAVDCIQHYMKISKRNNGSFWILKCDIKKFFYSIDPYILYDIISKYICDKALLNFTKLLIFDKRESLEDVGIPIGNYTSQFFANIYLNELDNYIKRKLKIKYYVRYMDDFILLAKTKSECIHLKNLIYKFLHEKLHLELNSKSNYYPEKMGVNFCGYRTFTTHRLLRNSSKVKIKNNIKKWNFLYKQHKLDIPYTLQSINSWIGHSSHCNSYNLQNKLLNKCSFLYNTQALKSNEQNLFYDSQNYINI